MGCYVWETESNNAMFWCDEEEEARAFVRECYDEFGQEYIDPLVIFRDPSSDDDALLVWSGDSGEVP